MNNPAYTWIKSVNADSPNKEKSDKIRKCLRLIFSFRRRKLLFWHSGPRLSPLDAVGSRVCLVLPHMMPAKIVRWSKRGGLY
jgi:hypothetical protein